MGEEEKFHFSFSSEFVRNGSSLGRFTVSSTLEGRRDEGGVGRGGEGERGGEGGKDEGRKLAVVDLTGSS